jgi:hypothetical protein
MGYHEVKPGQWVKPVGYVLFAYSEGKNTWANWFKGANGKLVCWETKEFNLDPKQGGSFLGMLKGFECWTRTDMSINCDSTFELGVQDPNL